MEPSTTPPSQYQPQPTPGVPPQPPSQPAELSNYGVFKAIGDAVKAINNNLLAVIAALVVTVILSAAVVLLSVLLLAGVVSAQNQLNVSPQAFITSMIIGIVLYIVVSALVSAFYTNFVALAINEGAEGKTSNLKEVFSRSLRSVVRVTLASLLVGAVIAGPIVAVGLLLALLALSGGNGTGSTVALITLIPLLAFIWVIIAVLRYALTPLIALFEKDVPLTKTLGRSKHLLQHGGQWFLVKGFFLLFVVSIILSSLTGDSLQDLGQQTGSTNVLFNILAVLLGLIVNGVMVMLYRNRRAVRS